MNSLNQLYTYHPVSTVLLNFDGVSLKAVDNELNLHKLCCWN